MFVVHNRIDVPAEAAEGFEKAFTDSMRTTLAGVPGLVRSTLLKPADPAQPYVSTMEFETRDHFLAWMRSDSFKAAHSDEQAAGMIGPSVIESFTGIEDVRG